MINSRFATLQARLYHFINVRVIIANMRARLETKPKEKSVNINLKQTE